MDVKDKAALYGAILGDLCGQPYEYKFEGELPNSGEVQIYNPHSRFTDDTILTLASHDYLYENARSYSLMTLYKEYTLDYQDRGFGKRFLEWAESDNNLIGESWGNGSIMRIVPFIVKKDLKLICESVNTSHSTVISFKGCLGLI